MTVESCAILRLDNRLDKKSVKRSRPTFECRPSAAKVKPRTKPQVSHLKKDDQSNIQKAKDANKPNVFLRLYLNLYSKKFKKNTQVIQAKKSVESLKKQKQMYAHSVQKKNSRRFGCMTNGSTTPLRYSQISRLIRFDNTRRSMFEDSARSRFSTSSYDPDNKFSQILRDLESTPLKSTVKKIMHDISTVKKTCTWEYVSIFDQTKGDKTDFVCFLDDELKVKPEHSEVPKQVAEN